ncbi:MAG: hypothetical protein HOJ06_04175, partial [Rhodospirillaceae bacterium]|nr:hypothetical protein [Rhodospirillaceae bacterium]
NEIGDSGAEALAALTGLTSLHLWNNQIGNSGAEALARLTGLTSLHLGNNQIGESGVEALAALTGLTSLNLNSNNIGESDVEALAALTGLTSLHLNDNEIGDSGAEALATLTGLTSLHLNDNEIGDSGAEALAALTGLTSLHLWNNQIGNSGAEALARLTGLTFLDLDNNQIGDSGVEALAVLTGLTSLYLADNNIEPQGVRKFFDSISSRTANQLNRLVLSNNNNLEALMPPEVWQTSDARALLASYRRYVLSEDEESLQPLNEAKLLIVGDEGVGKTSLVRFMVHMQPRDPDEEKTPGISILDKIETQEWTPDGSDIQLNVWDFGGQEIMRGTHRFFLTERSLYILLLQNRFEDDAPKVHEWLKTIRDKSSQCPVIVVVSKCDVDKPYIRKDDETSLRADYPNIVGFLRLSCNDDDESRKRVLELRALIAETLADKTLLTHVQDTIPAGWRRVKDAVAQLADERSILTLATFETLCLDGQDDNDRITDPDEQRALLRLLNDLGTVVAHGLERDAPAVKREITLLDPNWLTAAIYPVLEKAAMDPVPGEFSKSQLSDWLDAEKYPPERHEFILDMMTDPDIGLAARLQSGGDERYLVPRALPSNAPFYDNWPNTSIRFRYRYELLPSAFFARFIVEAHRDLTEPPTRWQTGAVLSIEGCPVLIRADLGDRQVDIMVDGAAGRGRAALNAVRRYLEIVHELFPETGPSARVPLTDQPEFDVPYEHLRRLEDTKGAAHEFLPINADREYAVRELLEGVRDDGRGYRDRRERDGPAGAGPILDGRKRYMPRKPDAGPKDPGKPSEETSKTSWSSISIGCSLAAMLVTLVLLPFGWSEWRLGTSIVIGVGIAVLLLVRSLNPERYFRWVLTAWLPFGPIHAGGVSFSGKAQTGDLLAHIRWDGDPSTAFLIVWAVVVLALIGADLAQQKFGRRRQ